VGLAAARGVGWWKSIEVTSVVKAKSIIVVADFFLERTKRKDLGVNVRTACLASIFHGYLLLGICGRYRGGIVPVRNIPAPQKRPIEWLNLNGSWESLKRTMMRQVFGRRAVSRANRRAVLPRKQIVRFGTPGRFQECVVSADIRAAIRWHSPRTLLHIGACDWRTQVWLNGHLLGEHVGGSAAFGFEMTRYLQKRREYDRRACV